jgi:hypothetical protein
MTKLPEKPWSHVSADFYEPLPTGEYLLVLMDDYSRFPIVEITTSISAKAIIPKLDKIFSSFVILNGSVLLHGVLAKHGKHCANVLSTKLFIAGNHTFSLRSCFVLTKDFKRDMTFSLLSV